MSLQRHTFMYQFAECAVVRIIVSFDAETGTLTQQADGEHRADLPPGLGQHDLHAWNDALWWDLNGPLLIAQMAAGLLGIEPSQ